jgi:putative transposase
MPWIERDETGFHAMEAVNVDGHLWDVMVDFGDGKPSRPMMIAIQDVYSRKMLGWRIARSENANAVRMAFADVFQRFGIPRLCFFDNGRAFASKWLTGGTAQRFRFAVKEEDQVGLLTQFGVEVHFTTPYSGQSKPIERSFRDLEGEIGTSAAFQGAYVGNNPLEQAPRRRHPGDPDRRVRGGRRRRHRPPQPAPGRRTKACAGVRSFDQAFQESYAGALIPVATPSSCARPCSASRASRSARRRRDPAGRQPLLGRLHDRPGGPEGRRPVRRRRPARRPPRLQPDRRLPRPRRVPGAGRASPTPRKAASASA